MRCAKRDAANGWTLRKERDKTDRPRCSRLRLHACYRPRGRRSGSTRWVGPVPNGFSTRMGWLLDERLRISSGSTASVARRLRRPIIVETRRDGAHAAAAAAASSPGAIARVQLQATAPRAICLVALAASGLTIRRVALRAAHPAKPPSRPSVLDQRFPTSERVFEHVPVLRPNGFAANWGLGGFLYGVPDVWEASFDCWFVFVFKRQTGWRGQSGFLIPARGIGVSRECCAEWRERDERQNYCNVFSGCFPASLLEWLIDVGHVILNEGSAFSCASGSFGFALPGADQQR